MDTPPIVGNWYEDNEGDYFVVVAIHPDRNTVEIGTVEGDVDEIDVETWSGMELQEIEPPEEWHGTMDDFKIPPGEEM